MLKAVLDLFDRSSEDKENPQYSVELATAALLSEIIRADNKTDEREKAAYRDILKRQFTLDQQALDALISEGKETAEEAVDLVNFTKVINQKCDNEQKKSILTSLWELAYADDNLAPMEEHTIRRIADLLYIPHSQFIKTKLSVSDDDNPI
ncbi:tellurite resistance TerB family protein [Salinimonas sediminis]|uniref:TerB family tellurite resistance protein n=1 Tax=Salinimonas sediminis TaxID=2303538 RepID=A0A346NK83_9ALTE|nr:TerB family tellurite resistance protein [Salinimonas sediminis]AXR05940.1 TerB family tellurite resistance protein [Salinimonas sediminis]